MKGAIYLIQDNKELVEMTERAYDSEELLQELLAKYPSVLAGDQINTTEPRRWLLIAREVPLPSEEGGAGRWWIDHLFLDQDGIPTLVEVKRSSDTRIRREVVGQMLEYAANAVIYLPIEKIRALFEANYEALGKDPEVVIAEYLGPDVDQEGFWDTAKTNLQAGRMRLVFVADEIPPELRRVVEFLGVQMNPADVFAIEIKQYVGQGLKTLVPRVIGQQPKTKPPPERQWDETSFLQEVRARRSGEEAAVAKRILDWAGKKTLRIRWGKGSQSGSFSTVVDKNGTGLTLFSAWTSGHIQIHFQHLQAKGAFDDGGKLLELLRRLNGISNVDIPDDAINRYPSFMMSALQDEPEQTKFLDAIEWAIHEISAS